MKKKVSLVLSSGGARGMAHIGVIEAGRYEFLKSYENWKTNCSLNT